MLTVPTGLSISSRHRLKSILNSSNLLKPISISLTSSNSSYLHQRNLQLLPPLPSSINRSFHSNHIKMSTPPTLTFSDTSISLIQLGQTSKDKSFNLSHAESLIQKACSSTYKPDLVVLPECFNSPYGVDYFSEYSEDLEGLWESIKGKDKLKPSFSSYEPFQENPTSKTEEVFKIDGLGGKGFDVKDHKSETVKMLSRVAREYQIVLVGGSIPEKDADGKLYNTSLVFDQKGHAISIFRKIHLFDIDIPGKMTFQESLTLTGGDRVTVFECSHGRFGLAICYDLRFPELAQIASRMGAGAMIYPGAFNTTTGPRHWELLQRSRATDNQFYICACSPARPSEGEKSYPSWGHSTIVNPWSEVVATIDEKEGIVNWKMERTLIEEVRKMIPIGRQRRWDVYRDVSRV